MLGMICNIVVDICATWKMVQSNSKLLHVGNIESASVVCRRSASVRVGLRRIGLLRLWRIGLLRLWRILVVRLWRIGLLRLKGYIFLVL